MKKSKRTGMAIETVVITHWWLQFWDALGAFVSDVGSILPPLSVTGGLPPNPTIFRGLGLVSQKRVRGKKSETRLCKDYTRDP